MKQMIVSKTKAVCVYKYVNIGFLIFPQTHFIYSMAFCNNKTKSDMYNIILVE